MDHAKMDFKISGINDPGYNMREQRYQLQVIRTAITATNGLFFCYIILIIFVHSAMACMVDFMLDF
jgi:hypothetical protein